MIRPSTTTAPESRRPDAGSHPPQPGPAAASAGAAGADAYVVALLAALGPARRAILIEVLRGLVALEAADPRVARRGVADETGAAVPALQAAGAVRHQS
jgi:hypothetical protein